MDRYADQLATYAKFLDPDELGQIERLLRSGKFGAQVTNGLITDAGRNDLGMGYSRIPEGTKDILGNVETNRPGIAQSRQNLLDFIQSNSGQVTPQAGPPNIQKINQAAQSGQVLQGMSPEDLQILDDVAKGRPAPAAPTQAPAPAAPVSRVIPDAKPIMSAAQPAPAAPQPRPSLTSTPSGPTKVSTSPASRGQVVRPVVNLDRPASAGYNPVPGGNVSLSKAAPAGRLAGEVVEQTPGMLDYLKQLVGGGKDVAKGAGSAAKNANNALKLGSLAKHGGRIVGGGTILGLLSAAGELADDQDPMGRNVAQAGGNFAGGLAGAGTGFVLGNMVLPGIGGVIGAGIGGFTGSGAGSDLAGGVYDIATNESPEQRRRQNMMKDAATQRQIRVDDAQAMIPVMADGMAIKRADDFQRAERELAVQNDYNYANALNQAMVNAQQQRNMQDLALTQFMMG